MSKGALPQGCSLSPNMVKIDKEKRKIKEKGKIKRKGKKRKKKKEEGKSEKRKRI